MYHASEATIRRYFQEMEEAGLAVRVHGGIRIPDTQHLAPSVPFRIRASWNAEEKRMIALRAAEFVHPGLVELMEGELVSVACLSSGAVKCPRAGACKTLPLWRELDAIVHDFFYSKKLTDLISQSDGGAV